ncbi:MAG: 30S ribosomal protein S13 [Promethearchaeota archaeon]
MSSLSAVRPKNFKEKVFFRKLRSQVDGNAKIEHSLTQITGIGRRFAQAIVKVAAIDPNLRIGAISEKELNQIEEIILNPIENGIPNWMVNRPKDLRSGEDLHIIGNKLEITVKRDIDRMKKIKSYKGVRHHLRLKVRGQRTRSTGRHGLVVGVVRKKALAKGTKKT